MGLQKNLSFLRLRNLKKVHGAGMYVFKDFEEFKGLLKTATLPREFL